MSKFKWMMTVLLALSMIAAACGDDDADDAASDSSSAVEEEPVEEEPAEEEPAEEDDEEEPADEPAEETVEEVETDELVVAFDANGDGTVTIGVAAAGPRDDNGYYQSLIDFAEGFSADNGFSAPIVRDSIGAEEAAQAMADLAQQGVDIIMVGASEIAEPLPDLTEEFSDIFWSATAAPGSPSFPASRRRPTGEQRFTTPPVLPWARSCWNREAPNRCSSAVVSCPSRSRPTTPLSTDSNPWIRV